MEPTLAPLVHRLTNLFGNGGAVANVQAELAARTRQAAEAERVLSRWAARDSNPDQPG